MNETQLMFLLVGMGIGAVAIWLLTSGRIKQLKRRNLKLRIGNNLLLTEHEIAMQIANKALEGGKDE